MRITQIAALAIVSSLLWTSSAIAAPQHIVAPADLRQAVADQAATDQQNREAVVGLLQRSQVRDVAATLGLNVSRAEQAVPVLDSTELANLAASARVVDGQLAGGSNTVVISTTTLLLIIIIVILVAR